MRIGVFDSGIGGLTVLKELVNSFPNNEYIYLADMLNSPFGDKIEEQIREITKKILVFLKAEKIDMIVCACGTISGVSRDILNEFEADNKIPVYEMTEGIKQALVKKNKKKIFLLATSATIKKGLFEKNIKYEENIEIFTEACPEFVKLLEAEIRDEEKIEQAVKKYTDVINKDIDSIVLGCTHYGLLKEYIKKYAENIDVFDSGKCLVDREDIKDIFKNVKYFTKNNVHIYTTKNTKTIEGMSSEIFNSKVLEIDI